MCVIAAYRFSRLLHTIGLRTVRANEQTIARPGDKFVWGEEAKFRKYFTIGICSHLSRRFILRPAAGTGSRERNLTMTSASVHRTVSVVAGVDIQGGGVVGGGGARNADLFIYLHFSPRYLSRRFFNDNNKRRQKKKTASPLHLPIVFDGKSIVSRFRFSGSSGPIVSPGCLVQSEVYFWVGEWGKQTGASPSLSVRQSASVNCVPSCAVRCLSHAPLPDRLELGSWGGEINTLLLCGTEYWMMRERESARGEAKYK